MTGQHPSIQYPTPSSMPPETLMAQSPVGTGVCTLGYDSRLLVSAYQPRLSVAEFYGSGGYADPTGAGYVTAGLGTTHPAMLYPTALTSPYDLKDPRTAWATSYPCDPTLAAYGAYGDRFDPVDSEARRRNATRETTSTLKAWLNEHRKNPYPTKGEKIMLAIITKMTLTQVSTWFANARRRLKKENKMTWEPRNKTGDDLDDVSVDEDDDKREEEDQNEESKSEDQNDDGNKEASKNPNRSNEESVSESPNVRLSSTGQNSPQIPTRNTTPKQENDSALREREVLSTPEKNMFTDIPTIKRTESSPVVNEKPKIWSLARTATSESPPPLRRSGLTNTATPSPVELDDRMRMNRFLFHDRVLSTDIHNSSPFHHRTRESTTDFRARLMHDSSADSSLSSPPLWRGAEGHLSTDKFGRLTPFDASDLISMSSSSSGSPVVVSSTFDSVGQAGLPTTLSYSPARFLGCRLLPCTQDNASIMRQDMGHHSPLPLVSNDRYSSHHPASLGTTLDLRTIHSSFVRPSPFTSPVNFTSAAAQHHHQATTALHRSKLISVDDGSQAV